MSPRCDHEREHALADGSTAIAAEAETRAAALLLTKPVQARRARAHGRRRRRRLRSRRGRRRRVSRAQSRAEARARDRISHLGRSPRDVARLVLEGVESALERSARRDDNALVIFVLGLVARRERQLVVVERLTRRREKSNGDNSMRVMRLCCGLPCSNET